MVYRRFSSYVRYAKRALQRMTEPGHRYEAESVDREYFNATRIASAYADARMRGCPVGSLYPTPYKLK